MAVLDRHGQPHPFMEIRHFIPEGWEDDRSAFATELGFLSRVVFKLEQIRDDLGSVGVVLAEQVGEPVGSGIFESVSDQGPGGWPGDASVCCDDLFILFFGGGV